MPASQAGRRRFEPGLPLHLFNNLGTFESLSINAITALSSRSPRGAGWRVLAAPSIRVVEYFDCTVNDIFEVGFAGAFCCGHNTVLLLHVCGGTLQPRETSVGPIEVVKFEE